MFSCQTDLRGFKGEGGVLAKFGDFGFSEHFSIQILRNKYILSEAFLKTNPKINIW